MRILFFQMKKSATIRQVEKLADTMKLQIKENKMIVNSSEKNAGR